MCVPERHTGQHAVATGVQMPQLVKSVDSAMAIPTFFIGPTSVLVVLRATMQRATAVRASAQVASAGRPTHRARGHGGGKAASDRCVRHALGFGMRVALCLAIARVGGAVCEPFRGMILVGMVRAFAPRIPKLNPKVKRSGCAEACGRPATQARARTCFVSRIFGHPARRRAGQQQVQEQRALRRPEFGGHRRLDEDGPNLMLPERATESTGGREKV